MDSLGKRIRQLRGTRSQAAYAARLGISKGALGSYERDLTPPDAHLLSALCTQEGVSADWLLLGKEGAACAPDDTRLCDIERRLVFVEDILQALLRVRREPVPQR